MEEKKIMVKKTPIRDLNVWEQFRHTIKPLDEKHRQSIPEPVKPLPSRLNPHREPTHTYISRREHNPFHEDLLVPTTGLSSGDIRKQLRVKKVCIEARIDLHGYTRQEALQKLQQFIAGAQQRQYEWILVITGKGQSDNPHTLRKFVPLWLEQMPQVNGYAPAKQRDGGDGAYYVRVRKR